MTQLTMDEAHCKRKHEVKMTETHELSRPVICLLYATHGVRDAPGKACKRLVMTDFVGQHCSHYQLRVVGALRLSTAVVAESFF